MNARSKILTRIFYIRDLYPFNLECWENNFVSINNDMKTLHISEVDFYELNDSDLVRLFEYLIRESADITTRRVNSFMESLN